MKKLIFGIFISTVFSCSVYGFNTSFLSYSPVFYFTQQDTNIMQAATIQALNSAPDNSKVNWSNPKTGAHGYVIPSNSLRKNGMRCRTLKIFNEAHNVTGEASYQFCKINNEWKVTH